MTPYERIEARYAEDIPGAFSALVDWHLRHGFVFSRPDYFVMGRPVEITAPAELIVEPTCHFPSSRCDGWYIHAMAGNLARVWQVLPWDLPWIAWQRHHDPEKVLRIYPLARMRRFTTFNDELALPRISPACAV